MVNNMKDINVLLISPSLSNKGGITTVVKNYLSYSGENIKYFAVETQIEKNIFVKIIVFIFALIRIKRILKKEHIDIVHMHISEKGSIYRAKKIVKIIKKKKLKIILHHHGAEFLNWYNGLSAKRKKSVSLLLESVDKNIVLSELLMQKYNKFFITNNFDYIYNGVRTYGNNLYLKNFDDRNIVLFLGRVGERKGIYDLIEVFSKCKFDEEIVLAICGDGELEKVKSIISKNNVKNIKIYGWIGEREKKEIFGKTLINILPSYNEGLPMTILETMSFGIPNISTNIASIPEVINSSNGFLISPGDKKGLFEILNQLCKNKNALKEYSMNAYTQIYNNFSIESQIVKTKKIYDELIIDD